MKDLFNLKDKIAVITGGSGFLGSEFALTLSNIGAIPIVLDKNKNSLQLLEKKFKKKKLRGLFFLVDLNDENKVNAAICIGGPHLTIMEEKAFNDPFDYAFVGDGEEAWIKFLQAIESKKDFYNVPGLIYRENGNIKKNKRTQSNKDLDTYPIAAYHLLKMGKYKIGTLKGRLQFTSIQTFRGCPWKCIFCASDALDTTRILKRSIKSIVDEIQHIVETYNVRHFMFIDDVLTLVKKRTVELCNEIIERKLNITFEGSTRANLLDDDLVVLMKRA